MEPQKPSKLVRKEIVENVKNAVEIKEEVEQQASSGNSAILDRLQSVEMTTNDSDTAKKSNESADTDHCVAGLSEIELDSTISKLLLKIQLSSTLHSLSSISNLTLEGSMDNSAINSRSTIDVPGQTKSKISPNGLINDLNSKLVIVMVGLPARGKSYLTKKITRYLNWLQYSTKCFNVGNTRRLSKENNGPAPKPFEMAGDATAYHDASFFDPKDKSSLEIREQWAMDTLDQLITYLTQEGGTVGIFDATNTTKLRRRHIIEAIRAKTPQHPNLKILFLESICTNNVIIERNMKLKLSGPDYKDKDQEVALKDFRTRLQNYERAYETIDEEEEQYYDNIDENLQYIKIINAGKKITSYNISGFLSSQVIFFMLNFNLSERQIWITRHGETYDNVSGRIGSTRSGSKLTSLGEKYSKALAKFMNFKKKEFRLRQLKKHYFSEHYLEHEEPEVKKVVPELHFSVWTSMLRQTVQTSEYFNENDFYMKQLKMLNELSHGKVNGMTLDKFAAKYPNDFRHYQNVYYNEESSRKKLLYRFPGGESYLDVINRLRPLIVELERLEDHVLLITHKVIARVLLAYFMNLDKDYITELDVPLHSVYVLEPKPYGVDWNMYQYEEETNWFYPVDKDKILRRKKKRKAIPTELVDLYSSSLGKKKKEPSFYLDSPPEPSTPRRETARVNFSDVNDVIFANDSDETEEDYERDNEHWYYQLDNDKAEVSDDATSEEEEDREPVGPRLTKFMSGSSTSTTPKTLSVSNSDVNLKVLHIDEK